MSKTENLRRADNKIKDEFINRWSPRSFLPETISDEELNSLFEAARWAPSAYNAQPWRFVYAKREDANWDKFVSLLVAPNQVWAKNASVLVFAFSDTLLHPPGATEPVKAITNSFDTGAAWANLTIQATNMGLYTHGMAGVEYGKLNEALNVPTQFKPEMAFVIGKIGPKEALPEGYQKVEAPSQRKPISEFAYRGEFK